ncbi:hypothetical protein CBM2634_U180011 [Cupriavidus taiwanensis]|uniref:Uncharacterized protein n=1 Tax=Cupriavidus taiwanensis TaxID=164546 RepID=A0A375JBL1_9BURK|nr:hypothetical protein CBM2634_U180011 [Cupriavidus taiwanensis]
MKDLEAARAKSNRLLTDARSLRSHNSRELITRSRDLYLVTRIDVKRVAKLLRNITDRVVPLTHAQEAISRACGFNHWYHFNSVSKRREADETFQPLFYPEPEDDELKDAAERLSEYLRERVDSEDSSFSVDLGTRIFEIGVGRARPFWHERGEGAWCIG